MKNLLKISSIIAILLAFVFCLNFNVYAANETTTNASVTSNATNTTTAENKTENKTENGTSSSTQVSSITSVDDNSLTTTDIINIFLIAVCVILILLAIAILIRLK